MTAYRVDVIIPTYKPDENFKKLIAMLKKQTYPVSEILIMNTEAAGFPSFSVDELTGVKVEHLKKAEFDHGGTRDRAASLLSGDLFLFLTQDALPADEKMVEELVKAFESGEVAAAYGRQLPRQDCRLIERYTRSFNYPKESRIKSKEDLPQYGIKTFFCSNVCAMYRASVYRSLGGFEKHTIFNEDMIFAGKLIQSGKKIAYVAEAKVIHSHNYSSVEQFKRNFDLAVSQVEHPEIFQMVSSESEGLRLVKKTAAYLLHIRKPWLIADLIIQSAFKYAGYRLGKAYKRLPKALVKKFSMNRAYWKK